MVIDLVGRSSSKPSPHSSPMVYVARHENQIDAALPRARAAWRKTEARNGLLVPRLRLGAQRRSERALARRARLVTQGTPSNLRSSVDRR
jgi:hypothetical protein